MLFKSIRADDSQSGEVVIAAQPGQTTIPNDVAMFSGAYSKDGQDLLISHDGSDVIRVVGYFQYATPLDLVSTKGALLRGVDVVRLAGAGQDLRYAQAQTATDASLPNQGEPIGVVETIEGTATVTRADGTVVVLNEGDVVFQNDVVQTDASGTLSLTFVDGTIFSLTAGSRMILDELIFDPDAGSDNSATFSLIQGSFVFIAGQVATTGGIDVETPAATLGIRGTTVFVQIVSGPGGDQVLVSLEPDPDGSVGRIELNDLEGNPITLIESTETAWVVSPGDDAGREVLRDVAATPELAQLLVQAVEALAESEARVESGEALVPDAAPDGSDAPPPQDSTTDGESPVQPGEGGNPGAPGGGEAAPPAPEPPQADPPATDPIAIESSDTADAAPVSQTSTPTRNAAVQENTAPVGEDRAVSFRSSEQVFSGTLAGSDEDGDPVTFRIETQPANGQITEFDPVTGEYEYTPNPGFVGEDTFTYVVVEETENGATSAPATVSIDVAPPNQAPEPVDQAITILEDDPVVGTVTATDAEGDALTFALATGPENGSVSVNPDGTFTYVPNTDYVGTDSFTVTVNDGFDGEATAAVSITVEAVNDAPVLDPVSLSTAEETELNGQLAATDVDDDVETLTYALGSEEGDAPQNGGVTVNPDGSFTYTPNVDFFGSDSFVVAVSDDGGAVGTGTVTVNVTPVNDAPLVPDEPQAVTGQEDTPFDGTITASDPDGDVLTFALNTGAEDGPSNGSVVVNSDGTFTYTPDEEFSGEDSFSVSVSDGVAPAQQATVFVTIEPTNDAPALADVETSTAEDTELNGQLVGTDVDDDDATLTYALGTEPGNAPENGVVTVNTDGSFTYTPNADFFGSDSFVVEVSDDEGATGTATVTVDVTPVNDAPVVPEEPQSVTVQEDTLFDGTISASDPEDDALSFALGSNEGDEPANGTVVVNADGTFTYTPDPDATGSDEFTVTVDDGNGGVSTATILVDVVPANDPPVLADVELSTLEDTDLSGQLTATDIDSPQGDLTYALVDGPSNGTLTEFNSDGSFIYRPTTNFDETDSFQVSVTDGFSDPVIATVTVNVTPVNDAPIVPVPPQEISVQEDTPFDGTVTASDPEDDALSFALGTDEEDEPANGTVIVNTDGTFTYTPDADFIGSDEFNVTVDDGNGGISTATIEVTVAATNDAPALADVETSTAEDTELNGQLVGTDVDDDDATLTYALGTELGDAPENGSVVVNTDGSFTYTPNADFFGTDDFVVVVSDDEGATDTATVTVDVTPVNDAPVVPDPPQEISVQEDTPFDGTVTASDPEDDALSFALGTDEGDEPANGTVVVNSDGTFTYTPDADYIGSDSFNVTVDDGNGGISTATIEVTVGDANDAPVLADVETGTAEDTELNGQLVATDVDDDDASLTYELGTETGDGPENGSVVVNADGSFTYTPNADFFGTDDFVVVVSDDEGATDTATVTVDVTPVNDAPIVPDPPQEISVQEDTPFDGTITASDPEDDALTFALGTDVEDEPSNGTVVVNSDGTFTYTPDADFNGSDAFNVTVDDGNGGTTTATIEVTVEAANDAPVPGENQVTTTEDQAVSGTVAATDVDDDPLTYALQNGPSNGTLEFNSDGSFTYTPDPDYNGSDSFTVTVTDDIAAPVEATVNITVDPANDDPVLADQTLSTDEDTLLSDTLSATDIDGDEGLQYTVISDVSSGTLSLQTDGSFEYTPDADFYGTDSFDVEVDDGNGGTDTATITIDVASVLDSASIDAVTGDNVLDVEEQINPIVITGTAEANATVVVTFAPPEGEVVAERTVTADETGAYSAEFDPSDVPDTDTFFVEIDVTDAQGNPGGSAEPVEVTRNQPDGSLTITTAGSVSNLDVPTSPVDLDLSDMPYAAVFEETDGGFAARAPTTTAPTSILYTADDGRTFALIGSNLNFVARTGIVTGLQIGTSTDPDYFEVTGLQVPLSEFLDAFDASLVNGEIDEAPFNALFAEYSLTFEGSEASDQLDYSELAPNDDTFIGRGGDDQFSGGAGNDTYDGGAGNDTLVVGEGRDTVILTDGDDFSPDFDPIFDDIQLAEASRALAAVDSLQVISSTDEGGEVSIRFEFTDEGGSFGFDYDGIEFWALVEAAQIRASVLEDGQTFTGTELGETVAGTAGDDIFNLLGNDALNGGYDQVVASAGNDEIRFTDNTQFGFHELVYTVLDSSGLTANINANNTTNTIDKGDGLGIDTLIDVQAAIGTFGLGIVETTGNDTFNITQHASQSGFIGLFFGAGDDAVNITTGVGTVRLTLGLEDQDVLVNLSDSSALGLEAGTASYDGGTLDVNVTGDPTNLTLEVRTGDGNDSIVGTAGNDRFILGAGTDSVDGGAGIDLVRYDRSGISQGVDANLLTQTATGTWDGQAFTHTLTNIENLRGSRFDDTLTLSDVGGDLRGNDGNDSLITGTGNDRVDTGSGFDTVVYSDGEDTIDGFSAFSDDVLLAGRALAAVNTLEVVESADPSSVRFQFSDGGGTFGFDIVGISQNSAQIEAAQIRSSVLGVTPGTEFSDTVAGTSGDDFINLLGNDDGRDLVVGSLGNDTIEYGGNSTNGYHEINYRVLEVDELDPVGITANIDADEIDGNLSVNNIQKPNGDTDFLQNVQSAAQYGLGLVGTTGNDTYNIDLGTNAFSWFGVFDASGNDVINLTGGDGLLRIGLGFAGNVTADLNTGVISEEGDGTIQLNVFGDTSQTTLEFQTRGGDDTVFGSSGSDRFILGTGNDFADGRDGFDTVRYDRSGVSGGVNVDLSAGRATGVWDGENFTHTLRNIEAVRGTDFDDLLTLGNLGGSARANDGNDTIITGLGDDDVNVGGGADLVYFSDGFDTINGFDLASGDELVLVGRALEYEDSLQLIEDTVNGNVEFLFTDNDGQTFGFFLTSTTLAQAQDVANTFTVARTQVFGTEGNDTLTGTDDDEVFDLLGNDFEDLVNASLGDDVYVYENNSINGFHSIDYGGLGAIGGITANVSADASVGTVIKGNTGFVDTLVDVQAAAQFGLGIYGTSDNDVYNVELNQNEFSWFGVLNATGQDTVNYFGGNGILRLNIGEGANATVDLSGANPGNPELTDDAGNSIDLNIQGSVDDTRIEVRTFSGDDSVIGSAGNDRFILGPGQDSVDGGDGTDLVRYDRSGVTAGVTASLLDEQATVEWDGVQYTNSLVNIEELRGSSFADDLELSDRDGSLRGGAGNDILRSGIGNNFIQTGAGADLITFQAGSDTIEDFTIGEDSIELTGLAATRLDSLKLVFFGVDDLAVSQFIFDDPVEPSEFFLFGVGGSDAYDIAESFFDFTVTFTGTTGSDVFNGTDGDDVVNLLSNDDGTDRYIGSLGNDTFIFSDSTSNSFNHIDYSGLTTGAITADISADFVINTITKTGGAGTDTLVAVQAAAQRGLAVTGTSGNDTYNLTLSSFTFPLLAVQGLGGDDTINLEGGFGTLRLRVGLDNSNITANLDTGSISNGIGDTITLNKSGDLSGTILEIETFGGNDDVTGSTGDDSFILGLGTDTANGNGGFDRARYDTAEFNEAIFANLQTQQARDLDNSGDFTHTLIDIDALSGSRFGDDLTASDAGSSILGGDGDDTINGGSGDDTLSGEGGTDSVSGGGGNDILTGEGQDELFGGTEDDLLIRTDLPLGQGVTDGGAGRDTLLLNQSGSFDFSALDVTEVYTGIEELNFFNGGADTVKLSLENIIDFSDTADPLLDQAFTDSITVLLEGGDVLQLTSGDFVKRDSPENGFDIYEGTDPISGAMVLLATPLDTLVEADPGGTATVSNGVSQV